MAGWCRATGQAAKGAARAQCISGHLYSSSAQPRCTPRWQAVHATLPALLASHRRCLAGEREPRVPAQDRVPTFGGDQFFNESARLDPQACLTCEQPADQGRAGAGAPFGEDEGGGGGGSGGSGGSGGGGGGGGGAAGACCDSYVARLAYAEAGFACERCLPRFHRLRAGNATCPREFEAFTCWDGATKSAPSMSRG